MPATPHGAPSAISDEQLNIILTGLTAMKRLDRARQRGRLIPVLTRVLELYGIPQSEVEADNDRMVNAIFVIFDWAEEEYLPPEWRDKL